MLSGDWQGAKDDTWPMTIGRIACTQLPLLAGGCWLSRLAVILLQLQLLQGITHQVSIERRWMNDEPLPLQVTFLGIFPLP